MPATKSALDSNNIPRPCNAWILFRTHYVQTATRQIGDPVPGSRAKVTEDSQTASEMWKSMSPEEKAPWYELSEEKKREHQEQYPNYKYKPGPAKTKAPKGAKGHTSCGEGWELVTAPVQPEPLKDETASAASWSDQADVSMNEGNVESEKEDSSASESSSSDMDMDNPLATASATSRPRFQSTSTPFLLKSTLKRNGSFHDEDSLRYPLAMFETQSSRFRRQA